MTRSTKKSKTSTNSSTLEIKTKLTPSHQQSIKPLSPQFPDHHHHSLPNHSNPEPHHAIPSTVLPPTQPDLSHPQMDLTVREILSNLNLPRRSPLPSTLPSLPDPPPTKKHPCPVVEDLRDDLPPPRSKRQKHEGVLRKLGQLVPNTYLSSPRPPKTAMGGHRLGAVPSSRLEPSYVVPELVLAISRKSSFSVYLKKAMNHFRSRKTGRIKLLAMGSAISMALSLAMAIEHNLNLGDGCALSKSTRTGTVVVGDEIDPQADVSR